MAKVRFEYNIDEIVEVSQFPGTCDEIFKGEEAKGKTFLFVDKLTGDKQVVVCVEPISESREYASLNTLYLPQNAEIISEEEKADTKHEAMMAHVQNCCDVIRKRLVDLQNEVSVYIGQEFDALKAEGLSNGNGISEKTLLEALKIVSKQTE